MPNNFPSVQEVEKTIGDFILFEYEQTNCDEGGTEYKEIIPVNLKDFIKQNPKCFITNLANAIMPLFTSYLDSITEGFPKEQTKTGLPTIDRVIEAKNKMLSLCKSYHIKVVAKLQEENSKLQKYKEIIEYAEKNNFDFNFDHPAICQVNWLEDKLEQKDKEIERLREALKHLSNNECSYCKARSIAQQALEGK